MNRPAMHPGEIFAQELEATGIQLAELARQIRVPRSRLNHIIDGKRPITGDTALRLGHWFGTSARFWLNLQMNYELRLAEQKAGADLASLPVRPETLPQPAQHSFL